MKLAIKVLCMGLAIGLVLASCQQASSSSSPPPSISTASQAVQAKAVAALSNAGTAFSAIAGGTPPTGVTVSGSQSGTNPVTFNYTVTLNGYSYNGDTFNGTVTITGSLTNTETGTLNENASLSITSGPDAGTVGFTIAMVLNNGTPSSFSGTVTVDGTKYSYTSS